MNFYLYLKIKLVNRSEIIMIAHSGKDKKEKKRILLLYWITRGETR
jgi:hypothetical protein